MIFKTMWTESAEVFDVLANVGISPKWQPSSHCFHAFAIENMN
jgi:hypothetical protein